MELWISDTHFSHKNIVTGVSDWEDKSGCRNFPTLEEHDQTLLDRINARVNKRDTLFHLGDWSFGSIENVKKFRSLIRCENIVLVYGNHDDHIAENPELRSLFAWTGDFIKTKVNKQTIIMSHYPFQVWEGAGRGNWMLHGHCHGHLSHADDGKILDVCPEDHHCFPWTFDEIKDYMADRLIVKKDHH